MMYKILLDNSIFIIQTQTNSRLDEVKFVSNIVIIFYIFFKILVPKIITSTVISTLLTFLYKLINKKLENRPFSLIFAYSILGISLGYLTGISTKEGINEFLPGLVTLMSVFLSYITTKELPSTYRLTIPYLIISLVSSTIIGIHYGQYMGTILYRKPEPAKTTNVTVQRIMKEPVLQTIKLDDFTLFRQNDQFY